LPRLLYYAHCRTAHCCLPHCGLRCRLRTPRAHCLHWLPAHYIRGSRLVTPAFIPHAHTAAFRNAAIHHRVARPCHTRTRFYAHTRCRTHCATHAAHAARTAAPCLYLYHAGSATPHACRLRAATPPRARCRAAPVLPARMPLHRCKPRYRGSPFTLPHRTRTACLLVTRSRTAHTPAWFAMPCLCHYHSCCALVRFLYCCCRAAAAYYTRLRGSVTLPAWQHAAPCLVAHAAACHLLPRLPHTHARCLPRTTAAAMPRAVPRTPFLPAAHPTTHTTTTWVYIHHAAVHCATLPVPCLPWPPPVLPVPSHACRTHTSACHTPPCACLPLRADAARTTPARTACTAARLFPRRYYAVLAHVTPCLLAPRRRCTTLRTLPACIHYAYLPPLPHLPAAFGSYLPLPSCAVLLPLRALHGTLHCRAWLLRCCGICHRLRFTHAAPTAIPAPPARTRTLPAVALPCTAFYLYPRTRAHSARAAAIRALTCRRQFAARMPVHATSATWIADSVAAVTQHTHAYCRSPRNTHARTPGAPCRADAAAVRGSTLWARLCAGCRPFFSCGFTLRAFCCNNARFNAPSIYRRFPTAPVDARFAPRYAPLRALYRTTPTTVRLYRCCHCRCRVPPLPDMPRARAPPAVCCLTTRIDPTAHTHIHLCPTHTTHTPHCHTQLPHTHTHTYHTRCTPHHLCTTHTHTGSAATHTRGYAHTPTTPPHTFASHAALPAHYAPHCTCLPLPRLPTFAAYTPLPALPPACTLVRVPTTQAPATLPLHLPTAAVTAFAALPCLCWFATTPVPAAAFTTRFTGSAVRI